MRFKLIRKGLDKDWIKIFSSAQEFNVIMLKGILEENDIDPVIINKKDFAYLFGEVELYVPKDQFLFANNIIKSTFESE